MPNRKLREFSRADLVDLQSDLRRKAAVAGMLVKAMDRKKLKAVKVGGAIMAADGREKIDTLLLNLKKKLGEL